MKEKVLLGKWSAIAMLELQRIRFAGWALTEGRHRLKAGKKKKTREAGLFFLVPTSQVMLHPKWVNRLLPAQEYLSIYLSIYRHSAPVHDFQTMEFNVYSLLGGR